MTPKQKEQFNAMVLTLKNISKGYSDSNKLRKESQKEWGLDYYEALEMAYENIQNEAAHTVKGIKLIK